MTTKKGIGHIANENGEAAGIPASYAECVVRNFIGEPPTKIT